MKNLSKLISISFFIFTSGFVLAQTQNLGNLIDSLGNDITFGYTTAQKISVSNITDQAITIQSPIIKDQNSGNIIKYTIMYSEYSLSDILEQTDLLNQTKEKSIELTGTANPFTMNLGIPDALDPTKKYYLFVIPKDSNGTLGEVSNEIRFSLAAKTFGDGDTTGSQTAAEVHNAAGADMTLANITHSINGNTITLSWIAVNGSTSIDISVMSPNTSSFSKIATVNMQDQSYSFSANANGEYVFQFTPNNAGRQVNYSIQIGSVTPINPEVKKGLTKIPKTGPGENILVIIIVAAIFYLGYKKLHRKAK